MFLYTVNRIMTIGMYVGIASMLTVAVGVYFYFTQTLINSTATIFQAGESLFVLSLILIIFSAIYETKKEKANGR